jgi:hypothetical protein
MKSKCDCGLSDNLAEPKQEWQVHDRFGMVQSDQ